MEWGSEYLFITACSLSLLSVFRFLLQLRFVNSVRFHFIPLLFISSSWPSSPRIDQRSARIRSEYQIKQPKYKIASGIPTAHLQFVLINILNPNQKRTN